MIYPTSVHLEHSTLNTTVYDCTSQIVPGSLTRTKAGCSFVLDIDVFAAAKFISDAHLYRIVMTTLGKVYFFRLSMPQLNPQGFLFQGVAAAQGLTDLEINVFYDYSGYDQWAEVDESQVASANPTLYSNDNNATRLFMSLNKGVVYRTANDIDALCYRVDPLSESSAVGIAFEYESNLPLNWRFITQSRNDDWSTTATVNELILTATGAAVGPIGGNALGAACIFFGTQCKRPFLTIFNNTGANYTLPGGIENGQTGLKILRPRLIGPAHTLINTTLTAAIVAPGSQTINVASTANMVAGMDVYLETGNYVQSEKISVVSVLNATQFTGAPTRTHVNGSTVRGARLTDSAIINDVITRIRADNTAWISNDRSLIIGSSDDQTNRQWYKVPAGAVLADLAKETLYSYGVDRQGVVFYYPEGTGARAWSIDALPTIQLARQIEGTINKTRVGYTDTAGVKQVTAYIDQVGSMEQTGVKRSATVESNVNTATLAAQVRQASVLDTSARKVQSNVPFENLYDLQGNPYPVDAPEPGDTVIVRNISQLVADTKLTDIVIADVQINYDQVVVTLTPDEPIRKLDRLLARINM